MSGPEYDYLFKILLIGDSGVGKSSILARFTEDIFCETYISTIGVDFKIKTLEIDNKSAKLQIWDTAGQERFRTITSSYYRGAHAVLIMFDITDLSSFAHLTDWITEKDRYCREDIVFLLVGTKSDKENKRVVTKEMINEMSQKYNAPYVETSAKDGKNIDEVFKAMSGILVSRFAGTALNGGSKFTPGSGINVPVNPNPNSGCC